MSKKEKVYELSPDEQELFISGRRLEDDYELFDVLGRGAYSSVVAARHKESGEEVAVKVMKRKLTKACPQFAKSTLNEIRVLQNLNKSIDSPGVLHVYGCYYDEGRVSVVTQQCTGGDMFDMILNLVEQGKQYNEQQCAKIFNELFSIIKKIHKQGKIVHNDLKHENFLLKSADPESPIVIADFGMAEPLPPDNTYKELKGSRNGTWGYMAPELLERSVHSVKTDIWALGVALYIALNASLPFDPKKVQRDGAVEIMKGIPRLNLDDPNRIGISADAADLLKNLFRFNPYKRFDADKALAHPFLSKWREQNSNDLSSLLPELRKFRARQKFRAACRAVQAGSLMNRFGNLRSVVKEREANFPPMQYGKIRESFAKHSSSSPIPKGRGERKRFSVARDAFANLLEDLGLAHLPVERLFSVFDTDNDGLVDFQEFLCGMALLQGPSAHALKTCFDIFDQDGNGYLDSDELMSILELAATGDRIRDRDVACTLEEMMEKIDIDGDGHISFEEFSKGVKEFPLLANALLGEVQHKIGASGRSLYARDSSVESNFDLPTTNEKKVLLVLPNGRFENIIDVDECESWLENFGIELARSLSVDYVEKNDQYFASVRSEGINAIIVGFNNRSMKLPNHIASASDLPVIAFPFFGEDESEVEKSKAFWEAAQSDPSDAVSCVISPKHAIEVAARICNSRAEAEIEMRGHQQ